MNENFWKSRWSQDQIKFMLLEQFDSFRKRNSVLRVTGLRTSNEHPACNMP
jgi:hypothetical protein